MIEHRMHEARWNMSNQEGQMLHGITYIWNLKTKQKKRSNTEIKSRKVIARDWGGKK